MKSLTALFSLCCAVIVSWAQVPNAINFQAIARDGNGSVLGEKSIGLYIELHEKGKKIYQEFHGLQTNKYGSFSVQIGQPDRVDLGDFGKIDWRTANKQFRILIALDGAQKDTVSLGYVQVVSAPYSFAAGAVTNIHDKDAQSGDVLVFDGTNWLPGDTIAFARKSGDISPNKALNGDVLVYGDGKWEPSTKVPLRVGKLEISSDTMVDSQVDIVFCDASSDSLVVSLPSSINHGQMLTVVARDASNKVLIQPLGSQKIITEGTVASDFIEMHANGDYLKLVSDGADWVILENGIGLYVRAYLTSSQSIDNGINTNVSFNKEDVDTHDAFDNAGGVLTIPEGMSGMYYIKLSLGVNPGGADWSQDQYLEGKIRINSSLVEVITRSWESTSVSGSRGVKEAYGSTVRFFKEGDKLEFEALQTTGGNCSISYGSVVFYRFND